MKDNKRTKHLTKEVLRLRAELHIANQFKELYLSKWEKWEERARNLSEKRKQ